MNKSVSDVIEEFIMGSLDDDDFIELSRNDLAKFFSCVPSQINYVLNTRFTINRGFIVESQRGGSGYIKIVRVRDNSNNFLNNVLDMCKSPLTNLQGNQLIQNMLEKNIITNEQADIIKYAIADKALNSPYNIQDMLRAQVMSNLVINLLKRKI